jgi:hypothetical protein
MFVMPSRSYTTELSWVDSVYLLPEIEVRTGVHMDVLGSAVRNNLRLPQDGIWQINQPHLRALILMVCR